MFGYNNLTMTAINLERALYSRRPVDRGGAQHAYSARDPGAGDPWAGDAQLRGD